MSIKREAFPAPSIGRSSGLNVIQRADSHESLSAHPLLSPTPSSGSPSATTASESASAPRYVPYTPRQRTVTASTTASTHSAVSVSAQQSQSHNTATGQLQLMNLKAAAQGIGIDTGTVGWMILEKLVAEGEREEWAEIWSAITTGKASLLLPLEQVSPGEKITVDLVKDHVVLCDTLSPAPMITLSGLRGDAQDTKLTIRSSLSPSSALYKGILDPLTRQQTFSKLPPLPHFERLPSPNSAVETSAGSPTPRAASFTLSHPYPTFSLPASSPSLPLPPRPAKPNLPPRPAARPVSSQGASRFGSPFASLFGKATPAVSPAPVIRSPTPSLLSADDTGSLKERDDGDSSPAVTTIEISAFAIDRKISRKDVGKAVCGALKNELLMGLASLPNWMAERVHAFATPLYPLIKSSEKAQGGTGGGVGLGKNAKPKPPAYEISSIAETVDEIADRFQEFYEKLEGEMRAKAKRKDSAISNASMNVSDEDSVAEHVDPDESKIRDAMEIVERTLTTLFYDRLFSQPTVDDAQHDEALSSRVAALNMLDLGLEHLDVDVGDAVDDIDAVIRACGETLSQLDAVCRCPADNAAVLVAAHKVVVDGLSRLPPVKLRAKSDESQPLPPPPISPVPVPPSPGTKLKEDLAAALDVDSAVEGQRPISNDEPSKNQVTKPDSAPAKAAKVTLSEPTPVSGDILLPLIIFAVVKANPPRLVSHLLYAQRFRNQGVGGEESYCLINLMAVAEFLENVDLEALGLGDSEKKVLSAADLTPIPITRGGLPIDAAAFSESLRGRVEQGVDALAGQANKVILGVVDTSFGVLRSIIPGAGTANPDATSAEAPTSAPWNAVRPSFGLLRRESGFSIASLAASLPGAKARALNSEETGQQLVTVSRPASLRSQVIQDSSSSDDGSGDGSDSDVDESPEMDVTIDTGADTRSIKSFESMMSGNRSQPRKSLTDRLALVPGLVKLSHGETNKGSPASSRRTSLVVPGTRFDVPVPSRASSPSKIPPPNRRFLDCTADDLKLSEVGELLREYQRLVEAIQNQGGFEE